MTGQKTIDLGAGNLRYEDYPIKAHVRIAARTITGFFRWVPLYGTVEAIPEPWNEPKSAWLILDGDQPMICNTARDTSRWSGIWRVSRSSIYECNCAIVTDAATGNRLFAVTGLKMSQVKNDDGTWSFAEGDDIKVTINNGPG